MNIGIFGGTFNPPHCGHLVVAERVREELSLDKVLFVPSAVSPHKQNMHLVDPHYRMEMVELALLKEKFLEASSIEINRGGVSYTVDTLEQLKQMYLGANLHLLIGMDNLQEFETWKCPDRILNLSRVVVMTRPGFQADDFANRGRGAFVFCQVPEIEISSSDIRRRVKEGKSIRFLVPKAVEAYIKYRGLYR